jgi:hypothetical protein
MAVQIEWVNHASYLLRAGDFELLGTCAGSRASICGECKRDAEPGVSVADQNGWSQALTRTVALGRTVDPV